MISTLSELEQALRRDPDDRELELVYADALVELGDPRGELIVLAHQLATTEATRELRHRERELRRTFERELFEITTAVTDGRPRRLARLVWRDGFIDRIDVDLGVTGAFERLAALLARPELMCLQAIDVRPGWSRRDQTTGRDPVPRLAELLADRPLRWLGLGARHEHVDVERVIELRHRLPRLRGLAVSCVNFELAPVLALGLADLEIWGLERGGYDEDTLGAILGSRCKLERLVLGGDPELAVLDRLAPIFDGRAFPELRQLGLMGGDDAFNDAFIGRLAAAPILAQLDGVGMTVHRNDASNKVLLEQAERFARVRWFTAPRYDGGWESAWHDLAHLYEALGRRTDALAEFDALLTFSDDATYWVDVGMQLAALDDTAGALAAHDRAIELDPKNGRAWSGRATALQAVGRHADAVAAWDAGQAAGLADVHTWSNRAYALMQLERDEEALVALDAALAVDPAHAWSVTNRATVVAKLHAPRALARRGLSAVRKWFGR